MTSGYNYTDREIWLDMARIYAGKARMHLELAERGSRSGWEHRYLLAIDCLLQADEYRNKARLAPKVPNGSG